MATYYVSATAPGGGSGAIGNPWTLAEFLASSANNDFGICSGTFNRSSALTVNGNRQLIATTGAKFRATTNITGQMLIVSTNAVIRGFEIDLNGTTSGAINAGSNTQIADCSIYGATAITQGLVVGTGSFTRCKFFNCSTSQAVNQVFITCSSFCECAIFNCSTLNATHNLACDYCNACAFLNWNGYGIRVSRNVETVIVCGVSSTRAALQTSTNHQIAARKSIFVGGAGIAVGANVGTEVLGDLYTDLIILSTYIDLIQTSITNPFVDYTMNDLRLTDAALESVNAEALRAIMIHFTNVPGPTFDPLSTLLGSGGSAGFTGIRGNRRFLGT